MRQLRHVPRLAVGYEKLRGPGRGCVKAEIVPQRPSALAKAVDSGEDEEPLAGSRPVAGVPLTRAIGHSRSPVALAIAAVSA